ncbi:MAG: SDR family oxidoreductase, partial [Deltaproteobacteria bacterium]|nr:SDR family oxidoreductase [Deltaproteobacteria bacterium]
HVLRFVTERAAPAPEAPVAPAPAAPGLDAAAIGVRVRELVAEKTGYPIEMLEDEDLDLEADLGIDTVKQAELLSALRESFAIPRPDDLKLSDYPTLGHVLRFVTERAAVGSSPAEEAPPDAAETGPDADRELRFLRPRLHGLPPLAACLPTGASCAGRVLVVGQGAHLEALAREVRARGGEPVQLTTDGSQPEALAEQALEMTADRPLSGVVFLCALGPGVPLDELDDGAWQRALDARARLPFHLARALEPMLANQSGSFFLCAVQMGGQLGLGEARDPMAGTTSGFVKSLAREWPQTLCKCIDFASDAEPGFTARALAGEVERDPATVELAVGPQGRFGIGLERVELSADDMSELPADPVVVITGGTGGVAPAVAADLASRCGGTYYLLGRTAPAGPEDEACALLARDRAALRQKLIARLKASGERLTPARIERDMREIERRGAARQALQIVERAGGRAEFERCDVVDRDAVAASLERIASRHGRIDLLLHAAGLDLSAALARKKPADFDRVLAVKADGLRALLLALPRAPGARLVLFGSIAGRFGNAGQTDYGAANDMLAKAAMALERDPRVLTLAFSAWDGPGMASRGSVPEIMQRAGVERMPQSAGAASVFRAISAGLGGEIVVAGQLGALAADLDAQAADLDVLRRRLAEEPERFAMLDGITGWTLDRGLELEVLFDPQRDAYLDDHRIEGTPVVPGVAVVECFAEACRLLGEEDEALAIEDLEFHAPLKLYRDEPRRAALRVLPVWNREGGRTWLLEMSSTRELAGGRQERLRHHSARIHTLRSGAVGPRREPATESPEEIRAATIYERIFFHGPGFQVLERATLEGDRLTGWLDTARDQLPLGRQAVLSTQPMLLELAFQAAGLAEARETGRLGLPAAARRIALHEHGGKPAHITARVEQRADQTQAVEVLDEGGRVLIALDGYRSAKLPSGLSAETLDLLRRPAS